MSVRIDDRARGTARAATGRHALARWRRAARLVIASAFAAGVVAPMAAEANCRIQVMEMPVAMVGTRAVATVGINGTQVPMMVDTGAFFSFLTEASAAQLQLKLQRAPFGMWVQGLTGPVDTQLTRVKSLQLAKGELPNIEFVVGGNDEHGTMGLLGRNILNATDVEYDLAHGVIRFIVPGDECGDANMAYWAGTTPVSMVDLELGPRESLPAIKARGKLNGRNVDILFDTGASSMVTLDMAKRVGVTPEQMTSVGMMHGAGHGETPQWTAPFRSFDLGGEHIENNRLEVADFDLAGIDMLLGVDFFLSHRIYVSRKQERMFFTYNGGPIFRLNRGAPDAPEVPEAATAAQAAASSASGAAAAIDADGYARRGAAYAARGDYPHAFADLDRACALDPSNAIYRTRRGEAHLDAKQPQPALADFDEALRLDPAQADARLQRAWIREVAGDRAGELDDLQALDKTLAPQAHARLALAQFYERLGMMDKALPQWNLWIPAHPHDVNLDEVQNQRCWARAMLDIELEQALQDCEDAVDAQSKNANYRDSRGWVYLRLGKLGKATDDFDRSLKLDPKGASSLFGRGLVHLRQGDRDKALADIEAARKARPSIDADMARYGIVAKGAEATPAP